MTSMKSILKLLFIAFTNFYLLYSFIIAEHKLFFRLFVALSYHITSEFTLLKITPININVILGGRFTKKFLLKRKLDNGKGKVGVLS